MGADRVEPTKLSDRNDPGRPTEPNAEARERGVERLVPLAASDGEGGAIVREVGDHTFVVLRIPSGGSEQSIELRVREVAKTLEANRVGGHDGDPSGSIGRRRIGFEEGPCRK
jgi:hypothetical protein